MLLFLPVLNGQQTINVSGGEAGGVGGEMSYSIGQIEYTVYNGTSGTMSQGVQQPYLEIMVGSEEPANSLSIRLFPNPASSYTSLAVDEFESTTDLTSFSYQLFDVYGHYLWSADIKSSTNRISTSSLATGMYIIKVFYKNQSIKTFRFIKTD